nr:trna-dihydrouridine(20) synthase [nad(p)+]-like [Quercus suber]
MDYDNKLILAAMVRVGTLPLRLLAAHYGADITYGEEIIDHKFVKCERRVNEHIGSTDFIEKGTENVVSEPLSLLRKWCAICFTGQLCLLLVGYLLLRAWKIWCKDVAAIDINMGCPKSFSISGGMGAALLTKPELIHDILTTLKRNLDTPVTCKIRLLKSSQDTVELARRIEKTGVSALAVHGRRVADRLRDPAKWCEIADVVAALSIPVIANGDIFEYDDFQCIKDAAGASSAKYLRKTSKENILGRQLYGEKKVCLSTKQRLVYNCALFFVFGTLEAEKPCRLFIFLYRASSILSLFLVFCGTNLSYGD